MKRNQYLSAILVFLLGITSCKDNYYIENDLHGMWQVTSIEKLSTGDIFLPKGKLYYMFQRSMVLLGYKHLNVPESMTRYISQFDFVGYDSIRIDFFRYYSTGEGANVNNETEVALSELHKFGFYQNYTTFHKQELKQELILTSDSARIILRKY